MKITKLEIFLSVTFVKVINKVAVTRKREAVTAEL